MSRPEIKTYHAKAVKKTHGWDITYRELPHFIAVAKSLDVVKTVARERLAARLRVRKNTFHLNVTIKHY